MENNNLNEVSAQQLNPISQPDLSNLKKKIYSKIIILSILTIVIKFLPNIIIFLFPAPDVTGMDLLGGVVLVSYVMIVGFISLTASIIISIIDITFTIKSLRKKYTKFVLIPGILGLYIILSITLSYLVPSIGMYLQDPSRAISINNKIDSYVNNYQQFIKNTEGKQFIVTNLQGGDYFVLELDNGMKVYVYTGKYDGNKNILIRNFYEQNITKEEKITLTPFTLGEYRDIMSNNYIETSTPESPIFVVKSINIKNVEINSDYFKKGGMVDVNRYSKLLTYIQDYYKIYGLYPEALPYWVYSMTDVYVTNATGYSEGTVNYFGLSSFDKDVYKYYVDNSLKEFLFIINSKIDRSQIKTGYLFQTDFFVGNKLNQNCSEKMFCLDENSLKTFKSNESTEHLIKKTTH